MKKPMYWTLSGLALTIAFAMPASAQDSGGSGSTPGAAGDKDAKDKENDGQSPLEVSLAAAEAALKDKNADASTKALIDLVEVYKSEKTTEKDKKRIVDVVGKFLRSSEVKVEKAGADALGGMGADGAKVLKATLSEKETRDESRKEFRLSLIENLGRTKQTSESKTLLNLLKDKDSDVIASAARALANYNDAKEMVRKEIAKEMINILDGAYNKAADNRDTAAVKKFDTIRDPMITSLQAVTGASVSAAGDWRKWYNDNKNKKWKDA